MIIENEQQYQNSLKWLQKFQESLAAFDSQEKLKDDQDRLWLHQQASKRMIEQVKAEITEYERLVNWDINKPILIKVESLNKLPQALIKARIAAKMSHKELGDLLGIDEQQIKQYEDNDYQSVTYGNIIEIATVLGVEIETALLRVDFEEIEAVKGTIEKWHQEKRDKTNQNKVNLNESLRST